MGVIVDEFSKHRTANRRLKVAISAGELSGDQHASHLINELRLLCDFDARGMGGNELRAAGVDTVVDCYKTGSAMGVVELLGPLRRILRAIATMKEFLAEWKPDVIILVDYPDFNMRLAKAARALRIPVYWYIPPKIWAWRSGRIKSIRKYVDKIGVIFPFEKSYYQARKFDNVDYVGHPVCSAADLITNETVETTVKAVGLADDAQMILLLPGSRPFEVDMILRPMLRAVVPTLEKDSRAVAVVVVAPSISDDRIAGAVKEEVGDLSSRVVVTRERADVLMRKARAGILKSGTCTLEAACAGLPFVCLYSGGYFADIVIRRLIKMKEFSPVNIIRAGTVVEIIQVHLNSDQIGESFREVYWPGPNRSKMEQGLADVRHALRPETEQAMEPVARRAAKSVLALVQSL